MNLEIELNQIANHFYFSYNMFFFLLFFTIFIYCCRRRRRRRDHSSIFCPLFVWKVCISHSHRVLIRAFTFTQKILKQKQQKKHNGSAFFSLVHMCVSFCYYSVAILYFTVHMPCCCFIEFPDYSLTVSKCFIHIFILLLL